MARLYTVLRLTAFTTSDKLRCYVLAAIWLGCLLHLLSALLLYLPSLLRVYLPFLCLNDLRRFSALYGSGCSWDLLGLYLI